VKILSKKQKGGELFDEATTTLFPRPKNQDVTGQITHIAVEEMTHSHVDIGGGGWKEKENYNIKEKV